MSGQKHIYMWSSVDRIGNTALTFTANIILARLLTPADFGLLAMVGIFTAIATNISGCGMSDGLIRKQEPTEHDYSTVFVFNAAFGLLFAVIAFLLAHPLATFFKSPQLVGIMWAIGICLFFQTLTFTQETRMRKELRMKQLAIVRLSATTCAVVLGVYLAATGYGYWGLVSCRVFLSFFLFVFYIIVSRWMPKIAFYRKSFNEMFGYGVHLMLAFVVSQTGRNINTFVLGRYSPAASGIYSQAQKMEEVPFTITETVLNWPFFAVLANEPDYGRRRELAAEMLVKLLLLNVTVGTLLMLLSSPGFIFLFGEKWIEAIPIFRILILFGILTSLKYFFHTILKVSGMTRTIRNLTFCEVALQLVILAVVFHHGIDLIAFSLVIAAVVFSIIYLRLYVGLMATTYRKVLGAMASAVTLPMIAFVVTGVGYWFWNGMMPAFLNCLTTCVLYMVVFIAAGEILRPGYYIAIKTDILKRFSK